jgi:predicted DNA-binding transcriptional regulator AlpA
MAKNQEEYLTVKELSTKIKFSQQTIYNMIHKGDFIKGLHYVKPRPKKILFIWSAVSTWLESTDENTGDSSHQSSVTPPVENNSLINI